MLNLFVWLPMIVASVSATFFPMFQQNNQNNFAQTIDTKTRCSHFKVEAGKLVGLTRCGKMSPTLTIPKNITAITKSSFVGCSAKLERIIFENFDLWIEANAVRDGCIIGTTPAVQYYTTSERVYHNLLGVKIDQKNIHMVEVTHGGDFFVITESSGSGASSIPPCKLIGLTTKCQTNSSITQLFIPQNTTKIVSNAFHGCPASITDLTLNTYSEITSFGKDALKGTVNVIDYSINFEHSAINLINSGFEKTLLVKTVKVVDGKIVLNVFNEYAQNSFIVKKQKKQVSLLMLTDSGKEIKSVLILPSETTFIDAHSFEGCQARTLDFTQITKSSKLRIDPKTFADLKGVDEYLVGENSMKRKLIAAGVDKSKIKCVSASQKTLLYVGVPLAVGTGVIVGGALLAVRRKRQKAIKREKSSQDF